MPLTGVPSTASAVMAIWLLFVTWDKRFTTYKDYLLPYVPQRLLLSPLSAPRGSTQSKPADSVPLAWLHLRRPV